MESANLRGGFISQAGKKKKKKMSKKKKKKKLEYRETGSRGGKGAPRERERE